MGCYASTTPREREPRFSGNARAPPRRIHRSRGGVERVAAWVGVERDVGPEIGGCVAGAVGILRKKGVDDCLVFIGQHTARRVDESASRFDERCRRGEDGRLLCREFRDRGLRLPPLEVGISPQRPEAGAGCVHQHAVDLSREALHLGVALACQHADALESPERFKRGVRFESRCATSKA